MLLNNKMLSYYNTQNQVIPDEGPKVVPLVLDFTAQDVYTLDLLNQEQQALISLIQGMFIDMKDSNVPLQITIEGPGQVIQAKGLTQGYYSVLCPSPPRFTFSCPGGPILKVILMNMPVIGVVWPTV